MTLRKRFAAMGLAVAFSVCFVVHAQPRAKATAAVGAIAASGAVESFGVLSGIGTLLLTAAGIDFNNGYLTLSDSLYYGSTSYDSGYELYKWVQETKTENQAMFDWFSAVHETVTAAGGFQAGQTFDVPAEVLEGARAWAVQHYDFSSGAITVNQYGMYSGDYSITFVRFPSNAVANSWAVPVAYGSIVSFPSSYTFSLNGKSYFYDFANNAYSVSVNSAITADGGFSTGAAPMWYLAEDTSGHKYLTVTTYEISSGKAVVGCGYNASSLSYKFLCVDSFLNTLSSTLTGSDVLGVPVTEDQKVKVPDVPMTQVGAVTLPVVSTLTRADVLAGTDNPDLPVESTAPVEPGTVQSILDVLRNLWETVKALPSTVVDSVVTGVKSLFIPEQAAIDALSAQVDTKLPFINDLKGFGADFQNVLENPAGSASNFTTVVDLGKKADGLYGGSKINLLNAEWYLPYKELGDEVLIGIAWLVFLWNLYGALPSIIHGGASGMYSTGQIVGELKKRGSDDDI